MLSSCDRRIGDVPADSGMHSSSRRDQEIIGFALPQRQRTLVTRTCDANPCFEQKRAHSPTVFELGFQSTITSLQKQSSSERLTTIARRRLPPLRLHLRRPHQRLRSEEH